jgi:hypothetical protein
MPFEFDNQLAICNLTNLQSNQSLFIDLSRLVKYVIQGPTLGNYIPCMNGFDRQAHSQELAINKCERQTTTLVVFNVQYFVMMHACS